MGKWNSGRNFDRDYKYRQTILSPFNYFSRIQFFFILWLFSGLLWTCQANAQSPSNLDLFYRLVDSSTVKILQNIPAGTENLNLIQALPEGYTLFQNRVIASLRSHGKNILLNNDTAGTSVHYTIDMARVSYPDAFRDGLFGTYKVRREIVLKGSYVILQKGRVGESGSFNFSASDTVRYDDIKSLEDNSVPFTKGEIPSEPIISTIWEPVVALGTAAVAVYLFFTVRSR
ncbi:MAG: hypothetical protein ACM3S2_16580 [Ignavibacteriales bacterium]